MRILEAQGSRLEVAGLQGSMFSFSVFGSSARGDRPVFPSPFGRSPFRRSFLGLVKKRSLEEAEVRRQVLRALLAYAAIKVLCRRYRPFNEPGHVRAFNLAEMSDDETCNFGAVKKRRRSA